MQLRVKDGREYVSGGKVHKSGALVEVQDKFAKVLSGPKGPLQAVDAKKSSDLPKKAYETRAMQAGQDQPSSQEEKRPVETQASETAVDSEKTDEVTQAEVGNGRRGGGRYQRRDQRPQE